MERPTSGPLPDSDNAGASAASGLFIAAYRRWQSTLDSFQLSPDQLFHHIELVDNSRSEQSTPVITWCPATDFVSTRHQLQRSLLEGHFPRALSRFLGHKYSWGVTITAPYLWEARRDPELTAAVLFEASLFSRMGHSRGDYPRDNWPYIADVGEVREACREVIRERLPIFDGWPRSSKAALPVRGEDSSYTIKDTDALWRYLAEEHARLYRQFRVLKIDFVKGESKGHIAKIRAL